MEFRTNGRAKIGDRVFWLNDGEWCTSIVEDEAFMEMHGYSFIGFKMANGALVEKEQCGTKSEIEEALQCELKYNTKDVENAWQSLKEAERGVKYAEEKLESTKQVINEFHEYIKIC